MSTPGLLLPPRSPALDELRVLAAGCRACSTKDYVDNVLHARGTKNVDVRAGGVTVRFELEPAPEAGGAAAVACPPSPRGGTVNGEAKMRDEGLRPSKGGKVSANGGCDRGSKTAEKSVPPAAADLRRASGVKSGPRGGGGGGAECFELSVGCCIYQKGKYLLGHAEGGDDSTMATAAFRHPSVSPRAASSFQPPPSPDPLPLVRESVGGVDEESVGRERRLANGSPLDTRSPAPSGRANNKPPLTATSSSKPTDGESSPVRGGTGGLRGPLMRDCWGGGPGPKPCEEAVAIIKSLRVPLSDPHYFRVADTSLYLGTMSAKNDGGGFVRRTQVLGGREEADDGWAGELLITRCAVVGNPRQPRTRADAMLSRIRVEVRWVTTMSRPS